ncbi:hypothetical protein O9G_000258 [Rozella allomycis CSF55]|uniref:Uncharacterized protein n=1 Tax=Rozella allomycis (strain CSF55) TaxID=988480 RepID=A0A075AP34_ROZAC|nr:hypothetical protein O9G_000258 [Rozella allomycis CSF55]|eukprot:EPZ31779.1 hypothetical protein O9G_000258 [Rozella allomycis CSF55]
MMSTQVTYGIASAVAVSYSSIVYRLVNKDDYQKVTSYLKATTLFGHVIASLSGQLMYDNKVDLSILFYSTFVILCFSFALSLFISYPKSEQVEKTQLTSSVFQSLILEYFHFAVDGY